MFPGLLYLLFYRHPSLLPLHFVFLFAFRQAWNSYNSDYISFKHNNHRNRFNRNNRCTSFFLRNSPIFPKNHRRTGLVLLRTDLVLPGTDPVLLNTVLVLPGTDLVLRRTEPVLLNTNSVLLCFFALLVGIPFLIFLTTLFSVPVFKYVFQSDSRYVLQNSFFSG